MLKADFHVHTHYSKCSDMKPIDVVKEALIKNYDVIGVVDHNTVKGALATKKVAGKKLLVLHGEEIKTNYGELLVFLSDGKYNRDLIDVCERAKEENHFIVVPHPFDFLRIESIKKNIFKVKEANAIEVFNSRILINRFNLMASNYAKRKNIPKIVGSDAHFVEEIGNASVFLECNKNVDDVLESIRKDKLKFSCKRCSIMSHLKSNVLLSVKRIF